MKWLKLSKQQAGATLIEVLVAIALLGLMLPALIAAVITANVARPTTTQQIQAVSLMHEATEAVRSVREAGWSNVAVNGTYHPVINGNAWTLASGAETVGSFSRQVVISDTERDSAGALVTSGGTTDPSTKQVVVTVSWSKPVSSSVSDDIYLTRWQSELSWTQTTQADFTGDTLTNTSVTNTSGGEVQLVGGQSSGTVESSAFDAGTSDGFNYLSFTDTTPSGTNIQFQIASNNDNSTWNYVGPDGTNSSFYTTPAAIPLSAVQGRFIRFKATLSTTNASTPVLDDVTVTYSP